ncbi:hypothetical protein V5O48_009604 [Marasmius crinis-equi]|uniref:F-box domain-containing protein n=1 Tax=Marasmius crinis-equi TaxID=585013 RepID=A0ABR3FAQ3_9AGAR
MHVCCFWRTIAINTPTMWSKPDFRRPKLAREAIKHSKSTPLDIEWTSMLSDIDLLLETLEHASSISNLELRCSLSDLTYLLSTLTRPVPSIRSVCLECQGIDICRLPNNLLVRDTPLLRHFESRGCDIPWGSPIFGNLTTFSIVRSTTPDSTTSLEQVASTLQAMAALEVVELSDFLPLHSNVALAQNMSIVLPRLKRMKLRSRGMAIATLLHRMSFPDTTLIDLDIPQLENAQDLLADYFSGLFSDSFTSTNQPRAIRTLDIGRSIGYNFVLEARNTNEERLKTNLWSAHFRCRIGKKEIWGEPSSIKERLLGGLGPLSTLESLSIEPSALSQDIAIQRFGKLPLLQRVEIFFEEGPPGRQCAREGIQLLSHNLVRPVARPQAESSTGTMQPGLLISPVYPALTTLTLVGVGNFDRRLVWILIRSLKLRSEYGFPVKKLNIQESTGLRPDDIDTIRNEAGVEVEWDDYVPSGEGDSTEDDLDSEYSEADMGYMYGEDLYDEELSDEAYPEAFDDQWY